MIETNVAELVGPNGRFIERATSAAMEHLAFCVPGIDSFTRHLVSTAQASELRDEDGEVFWEAAAKVLPSCDYILPGTLERLFQRFAASAPPVNLPKRVEIYRGQSGDAPKGLCWTLSRDVAERFAEG